MAAPNNVEFILAAEFDIDKGSVIRAEYPEATGVSHSLLAEAMLPEGAHLREEDSTVFFLSQALLNLGKGKSKDDEVKASIQRGADDLICLNLVRTKKDSSVRRGAIVKAMAVATHLRCYQIFAPLITMALERYFTDVNVIGQLFKHLNSIDLDSILRPGLSPLEQRVLRATRLRELGGDDQRAPQLHHTRHVKWGGNEVALRVPLYLEADEVCEASLEKLFSTFSTRTGIIHTALLSQKRVIFLGYQQPASVVCQHVLSACLLVAPPLEGILQRAHPYANLTNLAFLEQEGYIAGVTNPIFQQRSAWWDVLCDITTGEVTLSDKYAAKLEQREEGEKNASTQMDQTWMGEVVSGTECKLGEEWLRCMCRDWTTHLVRIAIGSEQFADKATQVLHTKGTQQRLDMFLRSKQFTAYKEAAEKRSRESPFGDLDKVFSQHVRMLQTRKVPVGQLLSIFTDFYKYITTAEQILELLSLLPESQGGLFPVAINILSNHPKVRRACVNLLQRIDLLEEGRRSLDSMNYYLLLTFYRHTRGDNLARPLQHQEEGELTLPQQGAKGNNNSHDNLNKNNTSGVVRVVGSLRLSPLRPSSNKVEEATVGGISTQAWEKGDSEEVGIML